MKSTAASITHFLSHEITAPFLLALLCLLCYANSFHASFQYDDLRVIQFNFSLRESQNWQNILRFDTFRPLLMATFGLNFYLGKSDPYSYHVLNLILHLVSVYLFYLFLRKNSPDPFFPLFAAALMACHPLNTESVTYITSRATVLCSVFFFLCLLALHSHLQKPRWYMAAGVIGSFILAAMSKEEGAQIPLVALLYSVIFFGRASLRKHRLLFLALFSLIGAGALYRIFIHLKYTSQFAEPLSTWIPTQAEVWLRYLLLAFFPVSLNADHDVAPLSFISPLFWISFILLSAILYLLYRVRKTHRILTFWGLWFFINLLTSSSLIPLNEFMAEHRTYISLFGFCACMAYAAFVFVKPAVGSAVAGHTVLVLLIAMYAFGTVRRNHVWQNDLTLWLDATQKSPEKIRPHLNLAQAYIQRKAYNKAIYEYTQVLRYNDQLPHPYSGLGIIYLRMSDPRQAKIYFEKALSLDPDFTDAKTGLGMIYYRVGAYDQALRFLTEIYPLRRESNEIVLMIVASCFRSGKYKQAIGYVKSGIENNPELNILYPTLMEAYYLAGDSHHASQSYDQYHHKFPQTAGVQFRVANVLCEIGRTSEATEILKSIAQDPIYGEKAQKKLEDIHSRDNAVSNGTS
jgi:Tfp pilus assembly protein PilF